MAEFIIRRATQSDVGEIRSLIRAVHINPTGLDWKRFLVAIDPREGFIGCGQIKSHSDGTKELASLAVKASARGHGVARAIIEILKSLESERPLYLMCRAHLESFYRKFGFQTIGIREMPLYYRRISRLVRFIINSQPEGRLLIMRLN